MNVDCMYISIVNGVYKPTNPHTWESWVFGSLFQAQSYTLHSESGGFAVSPQHCGQRLSRHHCIPAALVDAWVSCDGVTDGAQDSFTFEMLGKHFVKLMEI